MLILSPPEFFPYPWNLRLKGFDREFHLSENKDIPKLKARYPFLFPEKFKDSVWVKRQKDTLQLLLLENVDDKFPSMEPLEESLGYLFKHLKYYFPKTKTPRVIGVINNVDYQSKTIYTDSLLLISLDTYLGDQPSLVRGYSAIHTSRNGC